MWSLWVLAATLLGADDQRCRLLVLAEDTGGVPVPNAEITLVHSATGKKLTASPQSVFKCAPGWYTVTIWAPAFERIERRIQLPAGETSLRVGMKIATEQTGQPITFSGRIVGLENCKDERVWLMLFPLNASPDASFSLLAKSDCTFSVNSPVAGPFVAVVLKNGTTLGLKQVFVGSDEKDVGIHVDLANLSK